MISARTGFNFQSKTPEEETLALHKANLKAEHSLFQNQLVPICSNFVHIFPMSSNEQDAFTVRNKTR